MARCNGKTTGLTWIGNIGDSVGDCAVVRIGHDHLSLLDLGEAYVSTMLTQVDSTSHGS